MPEYKLKNGDVYSFTDDEQDKVKDLLADYPDAEEISKKVTPTNTDAVVEVDQASDTDSTLASGSSGLYDRKSMTGSNTYYDKLEKEKDSKNHSFFGKIAIFTILTRIDTLPKRFIFFRTYGADRNCLAISEFNRD